jgi:cell division transport system permease protein
MSAGYILREGMNGFRRAKLAAAGSVTTIVISLLFFGVFYLLSTNTSRIIGDLRGRVEMEVFLDEPVSTQSVNDIQRQLLALDGIDHVEFISKEDAAKIFKQEFGEDINGVLEFNPLPPSFRVYLKEPFRTTEKADQIQKKVLAIKGTDKVVYRRDILEFIEKQTRTINMVGLVVGLLVALSAIFLVSNTIRLTIHTKRKALHAMKLAGASRWFIRAPFLLEGSLQGVGAGIIAAAIMYYLVTMAAGYLSQDLLQFIRSDFLLYLYIVCGGIALGIFGSAISIHKYIRDTIG